VFCCKALWLQGPSLPNNASGIEDKDNWAMGVKLGNRCLGRISPKDFLREKIKNE
jgi:hypothetical protein